MRKSLNIPGGNPALFKFISENLNYPQEAQNKQYPGKGYSEIRCKLPMVRSTGLRLLRGIDPLLDNEAIRVVKTLPKFKPGKQGGIPVPVWFTLPVTLKLEQLKIINFIKNVNSLT